MTDLRNVLLWRILDSLEQFLITFFSHLMDEIDDIRFKWLISPFFQDGLAIRPYPFERLDALLAFFLGKYLVTLFCSSIGHVNLHAKVYLCTDADAKGLIVDLTDQYFKATYGQFG